jgi:predicted ATPase/signal transduction histidine kinase/CheY-like chemotaxis protein
MIHATCMEYGEYQCTSLIRESLRSVVQRGIHRGDAREVVIKTPAPQVPPAESLPRFRNEWFITRMFDTPTVARVIELIESPNETALIFESHEGLLALDERVGDGANQQRLSVRQSLRVALGVIDALAAIHAKSVVHKDIKPSNLLVDAELDRVVLIDFGIATVVPRELGAPRAAASFEGTLGYMAPEQTGRINRPIDYRSDYYGLGATLYWMLGGARPFASLSDQNELIHALLTRAPPLLSELRPDLPPVLARIVGKLLSTAADDRYQGSFGLRADLSRCLAALDDHGTIEDFELATVDPSERLRQPRRLYGRERERAQLLDVHSQAIDDGPRLVIVRGPSGSGKSVLINELREAVGEQPTVFARCKFDQYAQASPHAGVGHILGSLLEQLITSDSLHARVSKALGPNGAVLLDIIPEIETVLGAQLEVNKVGPAEARDRFWDTLERFADALLVPTLNFVLFIDDVQWADASSLRLIETLCLGQPRHLTIVLAARDDGLGPTHPLTRTLEGLERRGFVHDEIELGPLTLTDVTALVDDVLDSSPDTQELARLLHRRTGGTPLYVAQLLMAYYAEGIITVDRARGQWRADIERATQRESSGAVVEFLVEQFAALPQRSRRSLGIAACIGASFDLETLAAVSGEPIATIGSDVWDAVSTGHLLPVSATASTLLEYRFVHDRIQQVALEDLPGPRGELYLTLARRLAGAASTGEQIHALACYIAQALDHVQDPDERRRFAELCAEAGARAKAATVFEAAASHYANALRLTSHASNTERLFLLRVNLELVECLAMAGDRSAAESVFTRARELAADEVELARVLLSQVTLAMVPGDTERALELTMEAAIRFGLDLRRAGSQAWIGELIGSVLGEIETLGVASIPTRAQLDDPQQAAITRMLLASTTAAYLAGDINLYAALCLTIIRIGLAHGIDAVTGVAFVQLAIIASSALGDYEGARRYSGVGFAILERFPEPGLRGMAHVIKGSTIHPWIEPMAQSLPALKDAHVLLRASGMLTNAGYASVCAVMNACSIGCVLPRVIEDAELTAAYLESIGDKPLLLATRAHIQACEALSSTTVAEGPLTLVADGDPSELNPSAHFVVHALRALTCWMLGDQRGLEAAIEGMGPAVAAGTGMFLWVVFEVVSVAHACTSYPNIDEAKVEQTLAMLRRWNASCPENAAPLLHLLSAEWARARGQLELARLEYEAAADAAADSGMLHFEGLANERGAEVLIELGQLRTAVGYLEYARRSYTRWGARVLERRVLARLRGLGHARDKFERGTSTSATDVYTVDLKSIVKMSLALSEEIQLDGVLAQLLAITSENAGADRSAILLQRPGALELHAIQELGAPLRRFDPALTLVDASALLASSIIREVVRDESAVIIDDVRAESTELLDPYLRNAGVRSVLALPIMKRGERIGVLYLENRVTPGAFTHQHLRVLASLAAQAAVSIENARLFDTLREREAQWRALVDSAPDTIMILDREHRVEFSNHEAFGDGRDGEPLEASLAAPDQARVAAAIDYVFQTGAQGSFEVAHDTARGRRQFMARLGPIVREHAVDRVALISTDVTEQRELEIQFRQTQKLQAVGTLAGGVAHDFNNLLTVIIGGCELGALGLQQLKIPSSSLAGQSFKEILDAADRATDLTRQLLAFSRKQVLSPQHFDLNVLVRNIAKMLTRLLGEDVTLALELAAAPCGVHVDPGQIEQVMMNLAVNARDAMPRGGTLTIRTGHRVLTASDRARPPKLQPGRYVSLEIADTGSGIPLELQGSIFEPFFTTKESGKGTGLGLSTVFGIVEQSGGHVGVTSELGHGACFHVLLPADDEEAERLDTQAHDVALARGTETLLVVEDDPTVARLAAQLLGGQGYRVFIAGNADEALQQAAELASLDMLIADVVLPGPSGLEVAAAVTKLHPKVRVLYTSGYTDDVIVRHGVIAGTVAFLQKPFTRETLTASVRRVLDDPAGEISPSTD